jgi:hypothetical protein
MASEKPSDDIFSSGTPPCPLDFEPSRASIVAPATLQGHMAYPVILLNSSRSRLRVSSPPRECLATDGNSANSGCLSSMVLQHWLTSRTESVSNVGHFPSD